MNATLEMYVLTSSYHFFREIIAVNCPYCGHTIQPGDHRCPNYAGSPKLLTSRVRVRIQRGTQIAYVEQTQRFRIFPGVQRIYVPAPAKPKRKPEPKSDDQPWYLSFWGFVVMVIIYFLGKEMGIW